MARNNDEVDRLRSQLSLELARRPVQPHTYKPDEAKRELFRLLGALPPDVARAFKLLLTTVGVN